MKKKEELKSLENVDYVKYFNKVVRNEWWDNNSEVKRNLLSSIPVLILTQKYLIEKDLKTLYIKKLAGNYNAINCKLSTNERLKPKKSSTRDHIIGVALIGNTVWESIKEGSLTINNQTKWIYKNLFLWGGINMTRNQHKNEVDVNSKDDLMYKTSFNHYGFVNGTRVSDLKEEITKKIKDFI